jgi:opacity protein-like surface antigen
MELLMKKMVLTAASLSIVASLSAHAADISTPPMIYDQPVIEQPHYGEMKSAGGWYLRGDVGYGWNKLRNVNYLTTTGYADFSSEELKSSFSAGVGAGYQINKRLRTDLTLDYLAKSNFTGSTGPGGPCAINGAPVLAPNCISKDTSSYTAWSLLANAYVDLFTYGRVTAYAGAGLGATYLKWNTLHNTECNAATGACNSTSIDHEGSNGWRATAALMAGASIKLNCALDADLGYRYRYISSGRMFERVAAVSTGPGFASAIHSHEGRAGLRYSFGGCGGHETPAYTPPQLPPVYK